SRVHKYRLWRFCQDLAVSLGGSRDLLPFRVVMEGSPVLVGGFAAGVRDDVNEGGLGFLGVLGNPVADALHAVALEDSNGVVAEARFEGFQFAGITRV